MKIGAKRLAVVDDDQELASIVRDVAISVGYEVELIWNPLECSPKHCAEFDVIALDLMMPKVDGIELLRNMAGHCQAKLLLISGLGQKMLKSASQIATSHGLQVCGTLEKPYRISQLRDLLVSAQADDHAPEKSNTRPRPHDEHAVSESEFAEAIALGQIVVHFQPQVDISTRRWTGVEALARWQHPRHGLLFPNTFIRFAESPEFAETFTCAILSTAISQVKQLMREVNFTGHVSINLPAAAMSNHQLADRLVSVIDAANFDRSRVIMELTETSIPENELVSLDINTRMQMRGIKLSIDDFGTGFSSLERLRSTPFDELKIDLSFVIASQHDSSARNIVENAIDLGRKLGMKVVAEGVENLQILDWLGNAGCDIAQGYYVGKPMSMENLVNWAKTTNLKALGTL